MVNNHLFIFGRRAVVMPTQDLILHLTGTAEERALLPIDKNLCYIKLPDGFLCSVKPQRGKRLLLSFNLVWKRTPQKWHGRFNHGCVKRTWDRGPLIPMKDPISWSKITHIVIVRLMECSKVFPWLSSYIFTFNNLNTFFIILVLLFK